MLLNKLEFSRDPITLATLTVPRGAASSSIILLAMFTCSFHGLAIDPHRIITIIGAWPSIMGWMRFLNLDDVVAVLSKRSCLFRMKTGYPPEM